MTSPMNWFLDFDDTLASGAATWALTDAIPRLVEANRLPYDERRFQTVFTVGQQRANQEQDLAPLLHDFFQSMGWPRDLEMQFFNSLRQNYHPELFDDTLVFLARLRDSGQYSYVLSNNPRSPDLVTKLGIGEYIHQVLTPERCPGTQGKPHPSLWEYVVSHYPDIVSRESVIVGDDPWSDGAFAGKCGLPCWLVDRMNRFGAWDGTLPYRRVRSLLEITVAAS